MAANEGNGETREGDGEMRMQEVNTKTHGFTCTCCKCSKVLGVIGREKEQRFADLDGPSFEAYYCPECAEAVRGQ